MKVLSFFVFSLICIGLEAKGMDEVKVVVDSSLSNKVKGEEEKIREIPSLFDSNPIDQLGKQAGEIVVEAGSQNIDKQICKTSAQLQRISELEKSLLLAKTEVAFFRHQWMALAQHHRVLGLEALTLDQKAMHEKMVRMVAELYTHEKTCDALEKHLRELMTSIRAAEQADSQDWVIRRVACEVSFRKAQHLLQSEPRRSRLSVASRVSKGQVLDVDEDLNILIANFGRFHQTKIGMPFYLLREDQIIGKCRIVEMREYVSAALLEELQKDKEVHVGDQLILQAQKE